MKPPGSVIMMPLGVLYGAITRARMAAYRSGLFSATQLPAPVVSVGNITTGGTGKTPLVEWVCRVLANDGKKVCVLTRGYGRVNPDMQVVVSDGTHVMVDERQAGDEPFLLASNLIGVAAVVANASRVEGGEWAIRTLGADVLVLDDGFQHLRIAREMDIVTIDATNPWGDGQLLPHGRLREELDGLSRAHCVVVTRAEQVESVDDVRRTVQKYSSAPVFTSRMVTSGLKTIDGEPVDQSILANNVVGAFCGIGNPDSFFTHLRRAAAGLEFTRTYADHHVYQQTEIDRLVQEAKAAGATALVTTAKDAVKLDALSFVLPCYKLEIAIEIDQADQLIELIRRRTITGFSDSG